MNAYISTLHREIPGTELNIATLKLGNFDYGPLMTAMERQLVARRPEQRSRAAEEEEKRRRHSLRELHNCVFDVITRERGRDGTVFVGRGSWMYHMVGRWAPRGVVGWMLGLRQRGDARSARGEGTMETGSQEWEEIAKEG
jgi:hypothetical protein